MYEYHRRTVKQGEGKTNYTNSFIFEYREMISTLNNRIFFENKKIKLNYDAVKFYFYRNCIYQSNKIITIK